MSIRCMNAVWQESEHKSSALILMLAIADIADDFGVAWPGYEHLAWKTRMSRRTVMRLVATCAKSGELWMMHRNRQRSNVYIVTIGLSLGQLEQGAIQASKLGAMPPTGSDTLTPPPQVLVVIDRPRREPKCAKVVIPGSPRRDTAMAPDPPLPTTNRQRTIKEPPTTTAVDADVLAQLRKFGINGRKATELIVSYTETDELPDLVPRLSEWLIHLDKQPGVTSPIGLAITRVAERVDVPDGKYLRNLADEQRRRSYTEGEWADIIEH